MKNENSKLKEMIPERSGEERAKLFDYLTKDLKFTSKTAHQFLSLEWNILKRQRELNTKFDYTDNKPEGKELYGHNDQLVKETEEYVNAIDEAIQKLKECKKLVNALLEENN